jgi:hypothetical protein
MSGYHCLASGLAGIAVGMVFMAWILHRTDQRLAADESPEVGP